MSKFLKNGLSRRQGACYEFNLDRQNQNQRNSLGRDIEVDCYSFIPTHTNQMQPPSRHPNP
jgi:hypothetical protein